ncbi:hypothetical protein GF373_11770 [bacterium]|nr:hypothetical protein [bacterium]
MIVIGEKINATRKSVREAIASKEKDTIVQQITDQDNAGAKYIDLNAGNPDGNIDQEAEDMKWLIDICLDTTEKPLVIDSASAKVIQTGAEYLSGKRNWMLNSVKNSKEVLDSLLPIAKQYGAPVVALAMDEETIPDTAKDRMENCRAIKEKAAEYGISEDHLFFDPLVMPLSSNYKYGQAVMETLRRIKSEFPKAKTTLGLSNVSYGLPNRKYINSAFLIAAIANGLDSAFCDPTRKAIKQAVLLGPLVCGKDRYCRKFGRGSREGAFEE